MKILELRFKNLNSLFGEWAIDFTNPEYVSNGIFALTGPTGAGKSTILDAICLALYGATPRLGRITQSGNEIMSRQTGECYAEVVFESQAGRFRCTWRHNRARRKVDGTLQIPEHEIADADTGKLIETKKRLVLGVIEEKTGMDFDRFTRSILLAQGGFDTFLKAGAEQKSQILEQITGTGIYSTISERVHEKQRSERQKHDLMESEIKGIQILEPEMEKELQESLKTNQKQEKKLAAQAADVGKAMTWLEGIQELQKEIAELSKQSEQLQTDLDAFKPESERLERAQKAARLDGDYRVLKEERKQHKQDLEDLKTAKESLPEQDKAFKEKAKTHKACEQQTLKTKESLKQAEPQLQKVRSYDQSLAELKKTIQEAEHKRKEDLDALDAKKKRKEEKQKEFCKVQEIQKLSEQYLEEHSRDEKLVSSLDGVQEQLDSLAKKQQEIAKLEKKEKEAQTSAEKKKARFLEAAKQREERKQQREAAENHHKKGREALDRLLDGRSLRELYAEKNGLYREMTLHKRIADLESHRAQLEKGTPCPLCGSREHPFAEEQVPKPDGLTEKVELLDAKIKQVEDQQETVKKLAEAFDQAKEGLNASERVEAEAGYEKKTAEKSLADVAERLRSSNTEFQNLKSTVSAKLLSLGVEEFTDTELPVLLKTLKERRNQWQEQVKKSEEAKKTIAALNADLKELEGIIKTLDQGFTNSEKSLASRKKEHQELQSKRQELYGTKKPEEEERRLRKEIEIAEKEEKQAKSQLDEASQKLTETKTRIDDLSKRTVAGEKELQKQEADFLASLQSLEFADEKQFLNSLLSYEERSKLADKSKELSDQKTKLAAQENDRKDRLSREEKKKVTEKTLEEVKPQSQELEEALSKLRNEIAALSYKLESNKEAKERVKEKRAGIEAQRRECDRWDKLHRLIGSADGKKFRTFAQGLTFELMVRHANIQLKKMTDRYLLIRDEGDPLELNVIDNYQAGEIRPTKNLSGGESFIVSLTLALGLSKMASRKVRVDSLFLDEGFGTLDEEALETALETLSGLQQDGKLIGIISHVTALKERIGTQVAIAPSSGGRSKITGPGCKFLC